MKKGLVVALAVLLIAVFAGTAMADREAWYNPKFAVKVLPWIKVNPCLPGVFRMVFPQGDLEARAVFGWYETFYSNVPFSKTFYGHNPVDDFMPIPARQELDKLGNPTGRWDRLSIKLTIQTGVNALNLNDADHDNLSVEFNSPTQDGPGVPATAGWAWGRNSLNFGTPHDGEVYEKFFVEVDREGPNFHTDEEWYESADAGRYRFRVCEHVVAKLNTAQTPDLP